LKRTERLDRYTFELSDLEVEILTDAVTEYLMKPENFGKLEHARETLEMLQAILTSLRMKAITDGYQW
jgi:hypothetical protein